MSTLYPHWRDALPDWRWAPEFQPWELASTGRGDHAGLGNNSLLVVPNLMDRARAARVHCHRPWTILSAYRDPILNALVGGAALSQHKYFALDIRIVGLDRWALYECLLAHGFTGFGFYNTFLHADFSKGREWGKWKR